MSDIGEDPSGESGYEDEKVIDLDTFFDVGKNLKKCLESIDKYKKERNKLGENAKDYCDLQDFGERIYDNFKYLLDLLSDGKLQIGSLDNNNLSVELESQKSSINLDDFKKVFSFIKDFGEDAGMIDFTDEFNDGNSENLFGKYRKFKENIGKQYNTSIGILDEIDATIPNLREILKSEEVVHNGPNIEEQSWEIVGQKEIDEINNNIKNDSFPIHENKPSIWQRIKNFFTKTIPNFFKGNKKNNTIKPNNETQTFFDGAANVVKEQQRQFNEQNKEQNKGKGEEQNKNNGKGPEL